jgi:hypothetical protein
MKNNSANTGSAAVEGCCGLASDKVLYVEEMKPPS